MRCYNCGVEKAILYRSQKDDDLFVCGDCHDIEIEETYWEMREYLEGVKHDKKLKD